MKSNVANLTAGQFNKLYDIGTKVRYYPRKSKSSYIEGETTSPAWTLGDMKTVVVSLSVGTGGYTLDNIEVIDED